MVLHMSRNSLLSNRSLRFLACIFPVLAACIVGDGPTASHYETAYFESVAPAGVADGITPVRVLVHGEPGATLTLTATAAYFQGSDVEPPQKKKTVQLQEHADDESGVAEVFLVSSNPGIAMLSFELAPLAGTLELEFLPVQIEVGAPSPVELTPGAVVHELCVYSNTSRGRILSESSAGMVAPRDMEIKMKDAGGACEGRPVQWPGRATLLWTSSTADSELKITYMGPGSEALLESSFGVRGEAFPGYSIAFSEVEVREGWASLRCQLTYKESIFPSFVAAAVSLSNIRSVPPGISVLGSSSGDETATPATDLDGWLTLYFEIPDSSKATSVFATAQGGSTIYLGDVPPID